MHKAPETETGVKVELPKLKKNLNRCKNVTVPNVFVLKYVVVSILKMKNLQQEQHKYV